ncbi:MAG: hypothetical protein M5U12_18260 [Verrucomicrobia bacterium]|nr:hypothetical protein [Verrucomicrobiota bacterium]
MDILKARDFLRRKESRRPFCEWSFMSETAPIQVLVSELEKGRTVLARVRDFYRDYLSRTDEARARLTEQAIVIANLLSGWYTCLETQFLRISRFFENHLAAERWHQDLLEKMTLDLPGIRQAVIHSDTAVLLGELLPFLGFLQRLATADR